MRHADEARLDRLERHMPPDPVAEARSRRQMLHWIVMAVAAIRDRAVAAGIDPAAIGALQMGEAAASELQALGDKAELVGADEATRTSDDDWAKRHPGEPDPRAGLAEELERLGRHFLAAPPVPGDSFMAWLAWALAQSEPVPAAPGSAETGHSR